MHYSEKHAPAKTGGLPAFRNDAQIEESKRVFSLETNEKPARFCGRAAKPMRSGEFLAAPQGETIPAAGRLAAPLGRWQPFLAGETGLWGGQTIVGKP